MNQDFNKVQLAPWYYHVLASPWGGVGAVISCHNYTQAQSSLAMSKGLMASWVHDDVYGSLTIERRD